jgi:biopolymer transport protein ExbD
MGLVAGGCVFGDRRTPSDEERRAAEARRAEAEAFFREHVIVEITKGGAIEIEGEERTPEAVAGLVADRIESDPERQVRIRAHPDAPYQGVVKAVEAIKQAGIERIVFLQAPQSQTGSD